MSPPLDALSTLAGPIRQLAALRSEMRVLTAAVEIQRSQRSLLEEAAAELRTDMAAVVQAMDSRRAELLLLRNARARSHDLANAVSAEAAATTERLRMYDRRERQRDSALSEVYVLSEATHGNRSTHATMPSISNPYQGAAASTRASTALAASQDANDLNRAAQLRAEQLRAARERMRRRGVLGEIAARSANERLSSNGLSSSGVTSMLERFASLRLAAETAVQPLGPLQLEDTKLAHSLSDVCAVCLEPRLKQQQVLTLPCGHVFHARCARRWLMSSEGCPTCRATVPRGEREQLAI